MLHRKLGPLVPARRPRRRRRQPGRRRPPGGHPRRPASRAWRWCVPAIDVDVHEVDPPEGVHLHLDVRFLVLAPAAADAPGQPREPAAGLGGPRRARAAPAGGRPEHPPPRPPRPRPGPFLGLRPLSRRRRGRRRSPSRSPRRRCSMTVSMESPNFSSTKQLRVGVGAQARRRSHGGCRGRCASRPATDGPRSRSRCPVGWSASRSSSIASSSSLAASTTSARSAASSLVGASGSRRCAATSLRRSPRPERSRPGPRGSRGSACGRAAQDPDPEQDDGQRLRPTARMRGRVQPLGPPSGGRHGISVPPRRCRAPTDRARLALRSGPARVLAVTADLLADLEARGLVQDSTDRDGARPPGSPRARSRSTTAATRPPTACTSATSSACSCCAGSRTPATGRSPWPAAPPGMVGDPERPLRGAQPARRRDAARQRRGHQGPDRPHPRTSTARRHAGRQPRLDRRRCACSTSSATSASTSP